MESHSPQQVKRIALHPAGTHLFRHAGSNLVPFGRAHLYFTGRGGITTVPMVASAVIGLLAAVLRAPALLAQPGMQRNGPVVVPTIGAGCLWAVTSAGLGDACEIAEAGTAPLVGCCAVPAQA